MPSLKLWDKGTTVLLQTEDDPETWLRVPGPVIASSSVIQKLHEEAKDRRIVYGVPADTTTVKACLQWLSKHEGLGLGEYTVDPDDAREFQKYPKDLLVNMILLARDLGMDELLLTLEAAVALYIEGQTIEELAGMLTLTDKGRDSLDKGEEGAHSRTYTVEPRREESHRGEKGPHVVVYEPPDSKALVAARKVLFADKGKGGTSMITPHLGEKRSRVVVEKKALVSAREIGVKSKSSDPLHSRAKEQAAMERRVAALSDNMKTLQADDEVMRIMEAAFADSDNIPTRQAKTMEEEIIDALDF